MNGNWSAKQLKDSVEALKKSVNVYNSYIVSDSAENDFEEVLRSGVIKNFEIAYEVCWKFMQRWINLNISPNILKGKFRRELFNIAKENAIIDDAELWMGFYEARNSTAHIYDEKIADEVFKEALGFLPCAEKFVETMEENI